jgi:hypothetical protein
VSVGKGVGVDGNGVVTTIGIAVVVAVVGAEVLVGGAGDGGDSVDGVAVVVSGITLILTTLVAVLQITFGS